MKSRSVIIKIECEIFWYFVHTAQTPFVRSFPFGGCMYFPLSFKSFLTYTLNRVTQNANEIEIALVGYARFPSHIVSRKNSAWSSVRRGNRTTNSTYDPVAYSRKRKRSWLPLLPLLSVLTYNLDRILGFFFIIVKAENGFSFLASKKAQAKGCDIFFSMSRTATSVQIVWL